MPYTKTPREVKPLIENGSLSDFQDVLNLLQANDMLLKKVLEKLQAVDEKVDKKFQDIEAQLKGQDYGQGFINIDEAANFTKLSVGTIYHYVSKKHIPFVKRGGRVLFQQSKLRIWMETNKHDGERQPESKTLNKIRVKVRYK